MSKFWTPPTDRAPPDLATHPHDTKRQQQLFPPADGLFDPHRIARRIRAQRCHPRYAPPDDR